MPVASRVYEKLPNGGTGSLIGYAVKEGPATPESPQILFNLAGRAVAVLPQREKGEVVASYQFASGLTVRWDAAYASTSIDHVAIHAKVAGKGVNASIVLLASPGDERGGPTWGEMYKR